LLGVGTIFAIFAVDLWDWLGRLALAVVFQSSAYGAVHSPPPRSSEAISITAITTSEIDGMTNSRYMGNLLCNKTSLA
jgi:hypothetical protein